MRRTLLIPTLLLLLASAPAAAQDVLRFGEDAEGELSADDPTLEDGRHYEVWSFPAQAGRWYAVYMVSHDFNASVAVGRGVVPRCDGCQRAEASETGWDPAEVQVQADEDGMYRVLVTSANRGQTGRYILAVHDERTFTPASAIPRDERPSLQAGQEVRGELIGAEREEAAGDWEEGDTYLYAGRAGERLIVSMSSDDFDTLLSVRVCGGNPYDEPLALDDDGGPGTDSRIEVTLPQDCDYEIRAAALLRSEGGVYTLRVESTRGDAP